MWFCKHEWEVILNNFYPSPLERLGEKGSVKLGEYDPGAMLGTRIIILRCSNCGKLNKTIEKV